MIKELEAHIEQKSSKSREDLIHSMMPRASYLAHSLKSCQTSITDLDDLRQDAYLGLVDAVNKLDPSKPKAFHNYSKIRMLGSVQDGHRKTTRNHPMQNYMNADEGIDFLLDLDQQTITGYGEENMDDLLYTLTSKEKDVIEEIFVRGGSITSLSRRSGVSKFLLRKELNSAFEKIKERV